MIEIIPAIDIYDGKVVRLVEGLFDRKTEYADDPVRIAKNFEEAGIKKLHIVDLNGARNGELSQLPVIKKIVKETRLKIDVGGGLRTEEQIEQLFDLGVYKLSIGSLPIINTELWRKIVDKFTAERFIISVDVKADYVYISGWADASSIKWQDFINQQLQYGIKNFACTDILKDGTLTGPSLEFYKNLIDSFPEAMIIASGGVRDINDVIALEKIGITEVIVGKAIYEGNISIDNLRSFLCSQSE